MNLPLAYSITGISERDQDNSTPVPDPHIAWRQSPFVYEVQSWSQQCMRQSAGIGGFSSHFHTSVSVLRFPHFSVLHLPHSTLILCNTTKIWPFAFLTAFYYAVTYFESRRLCWSCFSYQSSISQAFQQENFSGRKKSQNLSAKSLGDCKKFNPEFFIHYCTIFARSACRAISGAILLVLDDFKTWNLQKSEVWDFFTRNPAKYTELPHRRNTFPALYLVQKWAFCLQHLSINLGTSVHTASAINVLRQLIVAFINNWWCPYFTYISMKCRQLYICEMQAITS